MNMHKQRCFSRISVIQLDLCFVLLLLLLCVFSESKSKMNVMNFEVILEVVDFEWPSLPLKYKKIKPLKNNNS